MADGDVEVSKLRNKVASLEVRQSYYQIEAPQDGYVVKAIRQGVGELVKAGDPIVTVQPATPRQAVELFVRAMDVPLLQAGARGATAVRRLAGAAVLRAGRAWPWARSVARWR